MCQLPAIGFDLAASTTRGLYARLPSSDTLQPFSKAKDFEPNYRAQITTRPRRSVSQQRKTKTKAMFQNISDRKARKAMIDSDLWDPIAWKEAFAAASASRWSAGLHGLRIFIWKQTEKRLRSGWYEIRNRNNNGQVGNVGQVISIDREALFQEVCKSVFFTSVPNVQLPPAKGSPLCYGSCCTNFSSQQRLC